MEADILALLLPDFFCNCVIAALLGSVKHSETHFVSAARIITFGAYVTLFPQLIAGPIVRYQTVADEWSTGIAPPICLPPV